MSAAIAYKLVAREEWETAVVTGPYGGSAVDLADGYIHLSGADTVAETARKYYADQDDLLMLVVDLPSLGETVVWEPSRGGALFPHIYGSLPTSAVIETRRLRVDETGAMIFADGTVL